MAWLGMLWIPVCTTLRAGLLYFVMRELQSQAFLGGSMNSHCGTGLWKVYGYKMSVIPA